MRRREFITLLGGVDHGRTLSSSRGCMMPLASSTRSASATCSMAAAMRAAQSDAALCVAAATRSGLAARLNGEASAFLLHGQTQPGGKAVRARTGLGRRRPL